jgi:hypothetical protein
MSTDDAWALPEGSGTPAVGPAAAGSGTESASVDAGGAAGGAGGPGGGADALAGLAAPPRPGEADRVLWLVTAGLLLIAGVVQLAFLVTRSVALAPNLPNYDFLALDAFYGLRALVLLGCGVLLLGRRSRELAAGMALGIAGISLARYFVTVVHPSDMTRRNFVGGYWIGVASYVLSLLAGLVTLIAVLRRPAPAAPAAPALRTTRRQSRSDRLVAVTAGFAGAVLWFIGECLDAYEVDVRSVSTGVGQAQRCCALSGRLTTWERGELVASGIALVALAVFAATLRSKSLGAGVVIGAVLIPLSDVVQALVIAAAPLPAVYSVHYQRFIGTLLTVDAKVVEGFWLTLVGLLVLTGAAAFRLRGARDNPYPELGAGPPVG